MEPFFGSGAVLLARPDYDPTKHTETVVDADGFVANVWRAIQAAPDEVAKWCDWPVNHIDLYARKGRLAREMPDLVKRLAADDAYYDAKLAGYWIWVMCCNIGSDVVRALRGDSEQVNDTLGKRAHLSDAGHGIAKQSLVGGSCGELDPRAPYTPGIYAWLRALSERLRRVRVVYGDWTRVCGGDWQDNFGTVGIFFDPPYGVNDRDRVYMSDSESVAHDVARWAMERGKRPTHRIVLAGYDEHEWLLEHGWWVKEWQTSGGFGRLGHSRGRENGKRERLYFSPHCLDAGFLATLLVSKGSGAR
jgi:hypothetical protein